MKLWLLLAILTPAPARGADAPARPEAPLPYRTDSSGAQLPWYRLKPGEFPPHGSEHRVTGELLRADFIHRSGQFRSNSTGEIVDFKLLSCGQVRYANADADLRDVPLGTSLRFSLYQDAKGAFTYAALAEDDFTQFAADGLSYRLDEAPVAGQTLHVTKQKRDHADADLGHVELRVNEKTRVWKGDQQAALGALAAGDVLLVNLSGGTDGSSCADIWAGEETHKLATAAQRKRHTEFLKDRGLAGWVDRVEGKTLAVTFFGDPADLQSVFKAEQIDPAQLVKNQGRVRAVVANADLRTYNPPVDGEGSILLATEHVPTEGFGCSGVSWVIQPNLMLEGFRKGRVIRLYAHPAWKVHDMAFGEGVYTEVPNAKTEEESPNQYPFRTDFGNDNLPWYQLKAGEFPPYQSQHAVAGELVKLDPANRTGQFKADRTGELVSFTMPPFGTALYHNAEADLGDLPVGTHYRFYLHQDEHGAFTRATMILDDFTDELNDRITYRLDQADLQGGKLFLARQLGPMKDERDHVVQPPDLGRGEFETGDDTRVWQGDAQVKLSDLAPGDQLLINFTGRTATSLGRCTEIWAGEGAQKKATDQVRAKHSATLRAEGLPGWIDRVDGKEITVTFFAANARDFAAVLDGDSWGKGVRTLAVDETLQGHGAVAVAMGFRNRLPEGDTVGSYGCSGVRWVLEVRDPAQSYKPGQILRVWKEAWPGK